MARLGRLACGALCAVWALAGGTAARAQSAPTYAIDLNGLHAYATRSKTADTLAVAFSVSLDGRASQVQSVRLPGTVTAGNDYAGPAGGAGSGLLPFAIPIAPGDTLSIAYAVLSVAPAAAGDPARALLSGYFAAGGKPSDDEDTSIWPDPLRMFVKPPQLFFGGCDGALAVEAFTVTGSQVAGWIAGAKGTALITHNFQSFSAPRSCGTSNYDVTVRFRVLPPAAGATR